jgi:hypothetical protein
MRTILIALVLTASAFAQSKATLDIGQLSVQLGMSKTTVLSSFPNYYLLSADDTNRLYGKDRSPLGTVPDGVVLTLCDNPPGDGGCYGNIEFKNNKLVYASRYWTLAHDDTEEGGLTAAVNGLTAVSQQTQNCRVESHQKTLPDRKQNYVWIFCGEHALVISSNTWSYQGKETPALNVEEEIGDK